MDTFLAWLAASSWLWGPYLLLFMLLGFRCNSQAKSRIYKITLMYYIPGVIALQLLFPVSQLGLRTLFFDIGSRLFLFVQGAEQFWLAWEASGGAPSGKSMPTQRKLMEDDDEEEERKVYPRRGNSWRFAPHHWARLGYGAATLAYLVWLIVGAIFAFSLIGHK